MPENNSSSEQVKTPEAEQVNNMKSFDFAVASKDIKLEEQDGFVVAKVPVQAPTEDRDGDVVTESGQEAAIKQFKSGEVGAFPNHGWGDSGVRYDFREMMGQWIDASQEDDVTMAKLRLRKDEDRESGLHKSAEELVDLLEQDMPVGFSIGFIPTDTEDREDGGSYKIHDMDLMECSPVGIPSNPMGNPQALSAADQMAIAAKGAVQENGVDPEAIGKSITEELKDTMGDETPEEDGKESDSGEPDTALSEHDLQNLREVFKDTLKASSMDVKITEDELDEVLGIVGGAAQGAEEDLIDGIESVADLDDDTMEDVGGVVESVMSDMVDSVESELEAIVEEEDEADEDDDEEDAADEDEDDDKEESSAEDGEEASADDGDGEDDGKEGEPDEENGLDEDEKTVDDSGKGKTLSGDDDLDDDKSTKDGYTPEPKAEGWGDTV